MKNILFLIAFLPVLLFGQQQQLQGEHVEVTPQDMEAMLNPSPQDDVLVSTLVINGDTLTAIGKDADAVIQDAVQRLKNDPPANVADWALYFFGVLASLFAMFRKWWPWLRRTFAHVEKDDTIVLVFSLLVGIGWAWIDGSVTVAEVFARFSGVFTVAVAGYKVILRQVWSWISGLFKKKETAPDGAV